MRNQRNIGQRKAEPRVALVVDGVQPGRGDQAVIDDVQRQVPGPFPEKMDLDVGIALREYPQGQYAQLEPAPRRFRARIEGDARPFRAGIAAILARVAAERKIVRLHAELARQFPGEPAAGGDAVKPHPVGVLGQEAERARCIEVGLVVLHEIEPLARAARIVDRIGRCPARRDDAVRIPYAFPGVEDRAFHAIGIARDLHVMPVIAVECVVEIHAVPEAAALEIADHAEGGGMPARSGRGRRRDPVQRDRAARTTRPGRRNDAAREIGRHHVFGQDLPADGSRLQLLGREPANPFGDSAIAFRPPNSRHLPMSSRGNVQGTVQHIWQSDLHREPGRQVFHRCTQFAGPHNMAARGTPPHQAAYSFPIAAKTN